MTLSKSKLLSWIQQQQGFMRTGIKFNNIHGTTATICEGKLDCWNLLVEAIEEGDFDV